MFLPVSTLRLLVVAYFYGRISPQKVTGLFDKTFSQNKLLTFWFTFGFASILRKFSDPILFFCLLRNAHLFFSFFLI